jgi:hypothetical protein
VIGRIEETQVSYRICNFGRGATSLPKAICHILSWILRVEVAQEGFETFIRVMFGLFLTTVAEF